jgi:cytochrome oxidase assembly protein ShyY1
MLRQFFSSRWMGYLALTVVFSLVATFFGLWQWDRRGQAVAAMDRVENNWDAPPLSPEEFRSLYPNVSQENEWTPLALEGTYVASEELLVRTRPRAGVVGFEVVVPFQTATETVLVSRGWVATGEARDFPDTIPAPPTGTVALTARVKMWEPKLLGRGAPPGQVATINIGDVTDQVSASVTPDFYLIAATESPSPDTAPLRTARPTLDEGPHLSYTFQWFLFALMAFVGYGWLFRSEWRASRGITADKKLTPSDAEEEDALLEDAGR